MNLLSASLLELIRRTSAEIPDDVQKAILDSLETERKGTIAESALKIIERNIELAKQKSQPICQDTGSILFYVHCPIEVLAERDVKGLYKKALAGEIPSFTGVSDPYEPPLNPEIEIDSAKEQVEESVEKVLSKLRESGLIQ